MKLSLKTEWPHLVLLVGLWVAAAMSWSSSPDRVPVHWNLSGQVDRYGGKFEGLILLPLIATVVYALLVFLPRIDPRRANYERFATVYAVIRFVILAMITGVYAVMLLSLHNIDLQIGSLILVLVGVLFVILGAVMPRIESNWFVGVRTPWTLTSQLSWKKTHEAARWVFMTTGFLMIAASLLRSKLAFWIVIGGIMIMTLGLVVYSYLVWRDDPERDNSLGH